MSGKICGLVPVYNNHLTIDNVVRALLEQLDFVIVVDDGSSDGTEKIVDGLKQAPFRLLYRAINKPDE